MNLDELVRGSKTLRLLGQLSDVWLGRFREANGPTPERVWLPLMAVIADIRYLEMTGQQREATRRRWMVRRRFAQNGLVWVSP